MFDWVDFVRVQLNLYQGGDAESAPPLDPETAFQSVRGLSSTNKQHHHHKQRSLNRRDQTGRNFRNIEQLDGLEHIMADVDKHSIPHLQDGKFIDSRENGRPH